VKKFVKGEADIGAIGYEDVEVKFVRGDPPVLTIFHDLVEVEKVDLSKFKFDELHKMMVEKGFVKKTETEKNGVIVKPPVLIPPVPTDPAIAGAAEHRTEDEKDEPHPDIVRMKREENRLRHREKNRLRHEEGDKEDPLRHKEEEPDFVRKFPMKRNRPIGMATPATPVVKAEDMARLDELVFNAEALNAAAAKRREGRPGMVLAVAVAWALALTMFAVIGFKRGCGKGGMTFADRRRVVLSVPFVIGGTYVILAYM